MKSAKRFPFSIQENNYIIELVKQMGQDWQTISEKLPGRTAKQIHDHYVNYLREGLRKDPWTKQEEYMILTMYKFVGPKWSKMMRYLPGRSGNDIKNRWYKHISKKINILNQNSNSGIQMNNNPVNTVITNNDQHQINSNNFAQICQQSNNASNAITLNYNHHSFNLVEPRINTSKDKEVLLPQQHVIDNKKSDFNEIEINVDNSQFNPEHINENQDFAKLINMFEIENKNENNDELFDNELFSEFGWSFSNNDCILHDMFNSNFDFFQMI